MNEHAKVYVPDGIRFGSKVLIVPGLASAFTHSGDVNELVKGQNYRWINRGEPFAEFYINGSTADNALVRAFTSKTHTAPIRSPASGLVLHSSYDANMTEDADRFGQGSHPPIAAFALLLPDDEPPPESGDYLFRDFARLIRDFRHYYEKPSRYWSMQALSEGLLDRLLNKQLASRCGIFNAMPHWADYFNEARTRHPNLRPHLRHLA